MSDIIIMNGVDSSMFSAVGFGPREGTEHGQLRVQFKNTGAVFEYDDLPQQVYSEFISSPSLGKFYNTNIRTAYQGRRID